jgi:hypothetical protein
LAKKYVVLNFTDYGYSVRTEPVSILRLAVARRVERSGGSYSLYHMADFFGDLREELGVVPPGRELEGLLDLPVITGLMVDAATRRSIEWSGLLNDCRNADKIIFASHGEKNDPDNVYSDHRSVTVRVGNAAGVAAFLRAILEVVARRDPTITLVVCYAARSGEELDERDIRSSLAFKIFARLAAHRPDLRLTARSGAVSAVGTTLTSETEEAIIASETLASSYPDSELLFAETLDAQEAFEQTIDRSNLTPLEQKKAHSALHRWFQGGFAPGDLAEIVETIDKLDVRHKPSAHVFLEKACGCGLLDLSWFHWYRQQRERLQGLAGRAHHAEALKRVSKEAKARYGKFIYQRDDDEIVVSRWVDETQLVEVVRTPA